MILCTVASCCFTNAGFLQNFIRAQLFPTMSCLILAYRCSLATCIVTSATVSWAWCHYVCHVMRLRVCSPFTAAWIVSTTLYFTTAPKRSWACMCTCTLLVPSNCTFAHPCMIACLIFQELTPLKWAIRLELTLHPAWSRHKLFTSANQSYSCIPMLTSSTTPPEMHWNLHAI